MTGFILTLIFAIAFVWLFAPKSTVPTPRRRKDDNLPSHVKKALKQIQPDIESVGFNYLGTYHCRMSKDQDSYLPIFINENCDVEFAIMIVSQKEIDTIFINEFSSSLYPHGELATNNNKFHEASYNSADKFLIKMPWVKEVLQLYLHHLEHLDVLKDSGFRAMKLAPEMAGDRIVDQIHHFNKVQIQKGRLKKLNDGAYKMTIKGALLGVPLLFIAMSIPILNLFVGQRSSNRREKYLKKCAARANRLPDELKMYHSSGTMAE